MHGVPWIELVKLAPQVIALCVAAVLFIRFNHGLYPVLKPRIELRENPLGLLVVRLEIENQSRVHAKLEEKVNKARVRIIELDSVQLNQHQTRSSESISFDEDSIPVLTSTQFLEPQETIRVELLHRLSKASVVVHCGFQVQTKSKKILGVHNPTNSFTTTSWMVLSKVDKKSA